MNNDVEDRKAQMQSWNYQQAEELPVLDNTEPGTLPIQPDLFWVFNSPKPCGLGNTEWNGGNSHPCDGESLALQRSVFWKAGNWDILHMEHGVSDVQVGLCFIDAGENIYCLFSKYLVFCFWNFILGILRIESSVFTLLREVDIWFPLCGMLFITKGCTSNPHHSWLPGRVANGLQI